MRFEKCDRSQKYDHGHDHGHIWLPGLLQSTTIYPIHGTLASENDPKIKLTPKSGFFSKLRPWIEILRSEIDSVFGDILSSTGRITTWPVIFPVISGVNVTGHDRSWSRFLVNLTGHKKMTMVMTIRNPACNQGILGSRIFWWFGLRTDILVCLWNFPLFVGGYWLRVHGF